MAVDVRIVGDQLIVEPQGFDKVWSFKRKIAIPLARVNSAVADANAARGWWRGFRLLGTGLPGIYRAGTWYENGERVFWDVRHPENAIVIHLDNYFYAKLIVEVASPSDVVRQINRAVSGLTA